MEVGFKLDWFIDPSLLVLMLIPVFVAIGIILGVYLSIPRKHQVDKYLPNDNRAYEFNVKKETRFGLFCDAVANLPPQAFFKLFPSTLIYRKGLIGGFRPIVRYIAREGIAFTQGVIDNVDFTNKKLHEIVSVLWGDDYEKTPERLRKKLEESKIDVTIRIGDPVDIKLKDKKTGIEYTISEDEVYKERVQRAMEGVEQGKNKASAIPRLNYILAVGCGIGLGLLVAAFFKIGILPPTPT